MIRNFNYTGRLKIDSSDVKIDTFENESGVTEFNCEITLKSYKFPNDSRVIIEPYRSQMRMRFDFGTVADIKRPSSTQLTDIPKTDIPLFTVKIVNPANGMLLGYNDRVHTNQNRENEIKDFLFPTEPADLGNRLWEVQFSDSFPVLRLNNRIKLFNEKEFSSPIMIAAIYPAALNAVLNRIAHVSDLDGDEEWVNKWLSYINDILGIETFDIEADEEKRDEWIIQVLDQFSRRFEVLKNFEAIE